MPAKSELPRNAINVIPKRRVNDHAISEKSHRGAHASFFRSRKLEASEERIIGLVYSNVAAMFFRSLELTASEERFMCAANELSVLRARGFGASDVL